MPKKTKKQKILAETHRKNPITGIHQSEASPIAYSFTGTTLPSIKRTSLHLATSDISMLTRDLVKTMILVWFIVATELTIAKFIQ